MPSEKILTLNSYIRNYRKVFRGTEWEELIQRGATRADQAILRMRSARDLR
jgi:hypothetical protein